MSVWFFFFLERGGFFDIRFKIYHQPNRQNAPSPQLPAGVFSLLLRCPPPPSPFSRFLLRYFLKFWATFKINHQTNGQNSPPPPLPPPGPFCGIFDINFLLLLFNYCSIRSISPTKIPQQPPPPSTIYLGLYSFLPSRSPSTWGLVILWGIPREISEPIRSLVENFKRQTHM